jgi:electron transfer flavoprotein alpha subunit
MSNSKLLVIAFEENEIKTNAGFAQALGIPFDILLFSKAPADTSALSKYGAETVFITSLSEIPPADATAQFIKNSCNQYTHYAALSNMRSKDILPRLAGALQASMVTDVIAIESVRVFKRPIVAGSLISTVEVLHFPVALTFRQAGFDKPQQKENSSSIQNLEWNTESKAKVISRTTGKGARPDLSQAKIIVSGGRPLKDSATFEKLIGGLADSLGGAAGATRAAVDNGIAANELQIGQTGKIVAPDLYIAAGISGATQHLAGIKDSKTIVAINTDPDAPIFEIADIGIVADLYDVIPEFIQQTAKGEVSSFASSITN